MTDKASEPVSEPPRPTVCLNKPKGKRKLQVASEDGQPPSKQNWSLVAASTSSGGQRLQPVKIVSRSRVATPTRSSSVGSGSRLQLVASKTRVSQADPAMFDLPGPSRGYESPVTVNANEDFFFSG